MRDTRKNEDYFKAQIIDLEQRTQKFQKWFDTNRNGNKALFEARLISFNVYRALYLYCLGAPLDEVKDIFKGAMKITPKYVQLTTHFDAIQDISMAYMLGIDNDIIVDYIQGVKDKFSDRWFFCLIASKFCPEIQIPELDKFAKARYSGVYDFYTGKTDLKELARWTNKEWYHRFNGEPWYNSHNLPDDESLYTGYWCFEIAGFLKLMGIDDELFKDCVYYPYDMAHYLD